MVDSDAIRADISSQAMHTLQQRLKLASVKAEHGWTDMSINEIENVCTFTAEEVLLLTTRLEETTPCIPVAKGEKAKFGGWNTRSSD